MPKIDIYEVDDKKINSDIVIQHLYVCLPCYTYIKSSKLKKILKISESPQTQINNSISCNNYNNTYKKPIEYTKCFTCSRHIGHIINGPDIINFLDKNLDLIK